MRVGMIGWRGMVGSVLMERMRAEGDFEGITPLFFSTSQVGQPAPEGFGAPPLLDAYSLEALAELDAILTCQGSDHTKEVYPRLREAGWEGLFIDASSALRMEEEAVIVLDPLNRAQIDAALKEGKRTFIGGNCTVSLMLVGLGALFQRGWVEWATSMTYQAASGAGARHMKELIAQMHAIGEASAALLEDPASSALDLDRVVSETLTSESFPTERFGAPLAASLIPWIDRAVEGGMSREENKAHIEANKILGLDPEVPIDGTCVRIGAMRCHSQALTLKLNRDLAIEEIEEAIASAHEWVELVPNTPEASRDLLSPAAVNGSLTVRVGRLRKMRMGPRYLNAFTVGDQLLWGAAEPLRRMLRIAREA